MDQAIRPPRARSRRPFIARSGLILALVASGATLWLRAPFSTPTGHLAVPAPAVPTAVLASAADTLPAPTLLSPGVSRPPSFWAMPVQEQPRAVATQGTDVLAPASVAVQAQPAEGPARAEAAPRPGVPTVGFLLGGTWVQNHRESGLYSGPDAAATRFTDLPQWSTLRVMETRPNWLKVYFLGDHEGRQPGAAWVPAADVGPAGRPPLWATTLAAASLRPGQGGGEALSLPAQELVEVLGPIQGNRVKVRFPGDGRSIVAGSGWLEVDSLQPITAPRPQWLPWAYPYTADPSVVHQLAPYRSQIDGAPYQAANCGPTALQMALAAFGQDPGNWTLRSEVQDDQHLWGDEQGSYIWALADVARLHDQAVYGLYDDGPTDEDGRPPLHHWTIDELRDQLKEGRVVIPQVWWKGLPGREDSDYWGDHFIVLTGLVGDAFLYNDPVDRDGVGFDRLMSAATLQAAMEQSVAPGAAFAVGR